MPITKGDYPATGAVAGSDTLPGTERAGGLGQPAQQTDALGAEIPVVVHASRYSSAARGAAGKSLPPVHETTRTVIIFPNGALVRVSASLTPGELVVLTNQQTDADVICRVTQVKAQAGIQNYVNLEFTQRAAGFWGPGILPENKGRPEAPSFTAPSPASAPTFTESLSPAIPPAMPVVKAPLTSSAPRAFAPAAEKRPVAQSIAQFPSSSILDSGLSLGLQQHSPAPSQSAARPFDFGTRRAEGMSKSKKFVLIATALVILAAGGFALFRYYRPVESLSPMAESTPTQETPQPAAPPQEMATVPPQQVASPAPEAPQPPIGNANASAQPEAPPVAPAAASPPAPTPAKLPRVEPAVAPIAPPAARPSIAVEKLSAPIPKIPAGTASSEPPPALAPQANPPDSIAFGGGLSAAAELNKGPAPLPPPKTEMQPPKVAYSIQPNYPDMFTKINIEGTVVLDVLVESTGKVSSVRVVSGPVPLQYAALDAIHLWRYEPAKLDGKPVAAHTLVYMRFSPPKQ